MKIFFKRYYLMAAVGMACINTGCEKLKDFGDINTNPNGTTTILTSMLITNVESQLGDGLTSFAPGGTTVQPGFYCQYFAEPTYPNASLYSLPRINSSAIYSGVLMDCQVIINRNTDPATAEAASQSGSNASQTALARVLKAYIYWTVTDRWGDVPYAEALKGEKFLTPKYDLQEDIYKDLLKELTEAVAQFDDKGKVVDGDIIYKGNTISWKKFANSLRMLIALRMSKRYPGAGEYAAQEFKKALNDANGFISTNADNFQVKYPGGNFRNPYSSIGTSEDLAVALTFTDLMVGLSDPRLGALASNSNGVPYGLKTAAPTGLAKIFSSDFKKEDGTLVIVSAASSMLAKAEGCQLGWATGSVDETAAKEAYDAGIGLSFEQWGYPIPDGYLTLGAANFNDGVGVSTIGGVTVAGSNARARTRLERIALQQYIAAYPDALQGWSIWRKTGMPDLKPTINALNDGGRIIRRYVYGTTEYNLNKAKLLEAIARFPGGKDSQDERVWWDKP